MDKMRIAIACSSLCISRGGSERAATAMSAEMARRGHAVLLLSTKINGRDGELCYGLPAGVRHLSVDHRGRHADIRHMRDFLLADRTDVFLSMQSDGQHLLWAMTCMGSGIPFICSERVDPILSIERISWNRPGRYALFAGSDFIHELLPTYIDTVPEIFQDRIRVIPNAAPVSSRKADAVGGQCKKLLYLARLCEQKRPLLLLDAFKLMQDKHPDWVLEMWGHGPHEKKLIKKIDGSGLAGRVIFRGICLDSEMAFSEAQAYCLPSYYEGFPNTALEAMSAGLPVVGFESCKGLKGVVQDGITGLLARGDDANSLADALDKLMSDAVLRKRLGDAGKAACAEYAPDKVFDQWESLFRDACSLKGHTAMDALRIEPFASRATLSAAARREWLYRDFGQTMPYSFAWWRERCGNVARRLGMLVSGIFNFS